MNAEEGPDTMENWTQSQEAWDLAVGPLLHVTKVIHLPVSL